MKEKSIFLKNTVILFVAMFITKIIGAALKIPLTNMIGGTGMGYFSAAYSFFNPIYTVLAAGMPVIVTRMTAQSAVAGRVGDIKKIKSSALFLAWVFGIGGSIFMLLLASPFVNYAAASPKSLWSVIAIAPSVLFCSIAAAYRGYYEGLSNMLPTAASQVLESVIKAVLGLCGAAFVIKLGEAGRVAAEDVLPLSAGAAVLGVSLGELSSTIFLILIDKFGRDLSLKVTEPKAVRALGVNPDKKEKEKSRSVIKNIIIQSLPISTGAVIINLGGFIDLLTVSGGIQECFIKNPDFFMKQCADAIYEAGADNFGNFVYGSYSGIVLSVFMLITSLTSLIGKSALPAIASAHKRGDEREIGRHVSILMSGTFLIGLPLCMSLSALASPILNILYPERAAEISVSLMPLTALCLGGLPIALCGALFSVFQAMGRFDLPIKLMMCGSAAKLIMNLIFLRIPMLSISAAALSSSLSYVIVMLWGTASMKKVIEIKISLIRLFIKPFAAASACCFGAVVSYYVLFNNYSNILRMALTVAAGGVIYALLTIISDKRLLKKLIIDAIAFKERLR